MYQKASGMDYKISQENEIKDKITKILFNQLGHAGHFSKAEQNVSNQYEV